jgi:hypothetical protein
MRLHGDDVTWMGELVRNQVAHIRYSLQLGEAEDSGGGDGGDIGLKTAEEIELACNGDNPGLFSIETCEGQPWVAANGIDVAKNPVCWSKEVKWGSGENPWVVGTAAEYNNEGYDCRTKCAGKSGESMSHCAADGWWNNETAINIKCSFGDGEAASLRRQAKSGWATGAGRWIGADACN